MKLAEANVEGGVEVEGSVAGFGRGFEYYFSPRQLTLGRAVAVARPRVEIIA